MRLASVSGVERSKPSGSAGLPPLRRFFIPETLLMPFFPAMRLRYVFCSGPDVRLHKVTKSGAKLDSMREATSCPPDHKGARSALPTPRSEQCSGGFHPALR